MGPEADEDKSPEVVDLSSDSSLQVDRDYWGMLMLLALKKFPIIGLISVHTPYPELDDGSIAYL